MQHMSVINVCFLLEFIASYNQLEEPQAASVSEAFEQILPFVTGLKITVGFSTSPEKMYHFSHLSWLELALPDAQSTAVTSGEAVQKLQVMLHNLPSLSYLHLHAEYRSLQPPMVVSMLRDLPNITSLKVDSGISPCMLSSQDLMHVTALSLGREVDLDQPPDQLQVLHMAYLGPPQKVLLVQLQQMQHSVSLIAGYCDVGLEQSPCKRHCCPHAHLAVDHVHIHAGRSDPVTMQPHKYICD